MGSKFTAGALLLALILMLTLACSGGDSPAAPETDRTQQELLDTIDRMDREMEGLRQEVEQINRTRQNDRPDTGKVQPTQEPEQTSTTEPAAAPTSEQEPTAEAGRQDLQGICYRTPELQEVILEMLDVELCQVVNTHELYRIRTLSVNTPSVKEGDFEGLVNITSLAVTVKAETGDPEIPANAFHGMEGLESLRVSGRIATIKAGAFQGLPNLENSTYPS